MILSLETKLFHYITTIIYDNTNKIHIESFQMGNIYFQHCCGPDFFQLEHTNCEIQDKCLTIKYVY